MEQLDDRIQLVDLEIRGSRSGIETGLQAEVDGVSAVFDGDVELACVFTDKKIRVDAAAIVPVTSRSSDIALYQSLSERRADWADFGVKTIAPIGDCLAPGTIAQAVRPV